MHKALKLGPIGKGFVQEIKTKDGVRFVARWNAFVLQDGERKRVQCGPHELGPKVHHGPGLKSLKQAQDEWAKIYWSVFIEHHPVTPVASSEASAKMKIKDFIKLVYEPRRVEGLESNSLQNWNYYKNNFLLPFFGELTVAQMNNEDAVRRFMTEVAAREFSEHTAKKAFTYVKALLDMGRDLGVISGNAARLIPKNRRIPKGVKKSKAQPFVTTEQVTAILNEITRPRDKIILRILYLCAVRRSELLCLKWKDFEKKGDFYTLNIQRSFDSQSHQIKEWSGKQASVQGRTPSTVAVPPVLAKDILGWAEYGDTTPTDPESYIFPARTGQCLIPTNWSEDVLKPAARKVGIPDVSFHWFRRGHATTQHHANVNDKPIQGQLRHSKVETTRNIYMQQVAQETYRAVSDLEAAMESKGVA